jgi:hypothetical protein
MVMANGCAVEILFLAPPRDGLAGRDGHRTELMAESLTVVKRNAFATGRERDSPEELGSGPCVFATSRWTAVRETDSLAPSADGRSSDADVAMGSPQDLVSTVGGQYGWCPFVTPTRSQDRRTTAVEVSSRIGSAWESIAFVGCGLQLVDELFEIAASAK